MQIDICEGEKKTGANPPDVDGTVDVINIHIRASAKLIGVPFNCRGGRRLPFLSLSLSDVAFTLSPKRWRQGGVGGQRSDKPVFENGCGSGAPLDEPSLSSLSYKGLFSDTTRRRNNNNNNNNKKEPEHASPLHGNDNDAAWIISSAADTGALVGLWLFFIFLSDIDCQRVFYQSLVATAADLHNICAAAAYYRCGH